MIIYKPICFDCSNYLDEYMWKAFPDGIPKDILLGDFDHIKKHPDQDNDIVFEPIT